MSSLIELNAVNKIYSSDSGEFVALKDIYFKLNHGEMLAIMGASGSGKSTLMNIMGFLDRVSSGKYLFDNKDVSFLSDDELSEIRNRKVGFVFQSFFLLPRLSALQNVMLPLFYRGVVEIDAKKAAFELLKKVKVDRFASHRPHQLSGGQQQRVAIARALVGSPEVIFADEPTGALDSNTGKEVMELLTRLNIDEQRTIIIVTHDGAIADCCSRKVSLKDGAILNL